MYATARLELDVSKLECPTSWGCGSGSLDVCEHWRDELCLAATPWTGVLDRFKLAWSMWENSKRVEAQRLIVECYMRLLPHPVFHEGCGVLSDYRRALRVVLDSTWAVMRILCSVDPDETDALLLQKFIASIEPLSKLDKKQKAAVYAIRGSLCLSPHDREDQVWFRKAIKLSPCEGEWRFMLGWSIQDDRKSLGAPSKEEISLLREAYYRRKNPDTVLGLARTLTDCGLSQQAEDLVEEALRLYPDHPRSLTNAANILMKLHGITPTSLSRVRGLFGRAEALVGKRAFIQLKLGWLCFLTGDERQGRRHYDTAKRLSPGACALYAATHGIVL